MQHKNYVLVSIVLAGIFLLLGIAIGWMLWGHPPIILSPLGSKEEFNADLPLLPYSFDELQKREFTPSTIVFTDVVSETNQYTSRIFTYTSMDKKISGMAHIPQRDGTLPVVVMIRGYVDKEMYQSGVGTSHAAEVFAKNGFITLAPDFLGFGESDAAPIDGLLERFSRPVQVLDLLASIASIPNADTDNVFLWGHSNGGQIALSVLEIAQKKYPTTLWAPVSKPFPYSILYYTDESPDKGKYLRSLIADFEKNYNPDRYSIDVYYGSIKAPIQIHQGTADDAVPIQWSDTLVKSLKEHDIDVVYFTYLGADHNMVGSWNTVVNWDIEFFKKYMHNK